MAGTNMELPVTMSKSPSTCAIEVKCIGNKSEEEKKPELFNNPVML
jgi:hypothetical protein